MLKNELIWQGEGVGYLTPNRVDKEKRINEFVGKILAQFHNNKTLTFDRNGLPLCRLFIPHYDNKKTDT
jgi:hypothetical protein